MRTNSLRLTLQIGLLAVLGLACSAADETRLDSEANAPSALPGELGTAPLKPPESSGDVLEPPPGALVLRLEDTPDSPQEELLLPDVEKSASCGGILNPCGIVYNRSGLTLQLCRDSGSHLYCDARGPYRDLPSGANSNSNGSPHWPDVDCVRSNSAWIVTNGRPYPPGEWIRLWTSKWIYGL
jgi:hypothetical protein